MGRCTQRLRIHLVRYFRPASAQMAQDDDPNGNRLLAVLKDADW